MRLVSWRATPSPAGPYPILLLLITLLLIGLPSPPALSAEDDVLYLKSADHVKYFPDRKLSAEGSVEMTYQDFTITADSVEADLETNIAVFSGGVTLKTSETEIKGGNLTFNLKTREWQFEDASSRIQPAAFSNQVKGVTLVSGAELQGEGGEIRVESGRITTCDLPEPHYSLKAREIEIYPDRKIVAHKVSVAGLGHTLFTLNTLLVPISGPARRNILPQVGSTAEEGTFLKTSYAYAATERQQGFLKLDLMSKRGIGGGLDHAYKLDGGNGQATLYYLQDNQLGGSNITGTVRHNQKLGDVTMDLTGNYRTNNYLYYPASTARNLQLGFNQSSPASSTSLNFRDDISSSSTTTENFNASLRHMQRFSDALNGTLSLDMRSYGTTSFPSDRELDSVLELRQRGKKLALSMVASRRTDLDGDSYTNDDAYGGLDRLPEITLETDSYRLGEKLFFGIPSRLSISAGSYVERPKDTSSERLLLQWDMLGKNMDIGEKNELNLTGGIRQAFYGSDMAQYLVRGNATLTTRYTDALKSRTVYSYQRPEGYSPFQFDYTGKYNYLRTTLDFQKEKRLRWSVGSGYDFNRDENEWQDVTFRLTAHPDNALGYSVSTGYDINRSKWRSLIGRLQIDRGKRLKLDMATRYDLAGDGLDTARARFDWRVDRKWRVEGISGWNGANKVWDYQAYRLTRDLHCCEMSLTWKEETGFRPDRGFSLDFRIKALPFQDRFAIGRYGNEFDTSMGEYLY